MRAIEIFENDSITLDISGIMNSDVRQLFNVFKKAGFELRIVGGTPRDMILGKAPKDLDFATTATPDEMMKIAKDNNLHVIKTGLQHGTITFIGPETKEGYEITTLRIDTNADGRHADVQFTTDWKVDAKRRDLTFNSLSMDETGKVYDYFDGIEDLKAGKAKFVGNADARIKEDYLRILRYFRFQGRTDKPSWDSETLQAIKQHASGLQKISGERIWSEMGKILSGNFAVEILTKMHQNDVDKEIGISFARLGEFKRVYNIIKTPILLLTTLIDNESELDALNSKWKFSKDERELMRFIIQFRDENLDISEAKRLYVNNKIPNEWVRALAYYQGKPNIAAELKSWQKPVFPITGKDMIEAGITPGIQMGKLLQKMKDSWTDSGYELTKDELMNRMGI